MQAHDVLLDAPFLFHRYSDEILSGWWIPQPEKSPIRKMWPRAHTSPHTERTISVILLTVPGLKWNGLLYLKTLCQTNDLATERKEKESKSKRCNVVYQFGFKTSTLRKRKRKKEIVPGDNKYRKNPSHEICLRASIWTDWGQQHQSQEPVPFSCYLHEQKFPCFPPPHFCSKKTNKNKTYLVIDRNVKKIKGVSSPHFVVNTVFL